MKPVAVSRRGLHLVEIAASEALQRLVKIPLENFDILHRRLWKPILVIPYIGNDPESKEGKFRRDLESKSCSFGEVFNKAMRVQRFVNTASLLLCSWSPLLSLDLR